MNDEIKVKALELTDEDAEKAAGGCDCDKLTKKCGSCGQVFDYNLDRCPVCNYDKGQVFKGDRYLRAFPSPAEHPR